jgi:hypothetical protein
MDQTITVLLYASLAAASAGLGVVPLLGRRRLPVGWLGVASAVAGDSACMSVIMSRDGAAAFR